MRRSFNFLAALLVAGVLLSAPPARALIIFGLDNAGNLTAPPNGAPWANVGEAEGGTGIYIGHGYVLTASHFSLPPKIALGGVNYFRDTNFGEVVIEPHDLRIFKIVNPPPLPTLLLTTVLDDDLNKDCTLIGTGKGKGAFIDTLTEKGWFWGGTSTRDMRWGLNKTLPTAANRSDSRSGLSYVGLQFRFDQLTPAGSAEAVNEAALAESDSGSGLFIKFGTTWKVAGVNAAVLVGGKSTYVPAEYNYAIRVREYSHWLRYEAWSAKYFSTTTAPENGDLDGDGVPNLLEYFLGLDPENPDPAGAPVVGTDGTNLTLTYTQLASPTDVSFVIEESTDLASEWKPVTPASSMVVETVGVIRKVKATIPMGSGGMKFLRLRVMRL